MNLVERLVAKTYFISDTHFGHESIIRMSHRRFGTVAEMDEHMISAWNSVIHRDDEVWHLGDFGYKLSAERQSQIFAKLKGRKRLIRGNHDGEETLGLDWESVSDIETVVVDGFKICLCHYPMREWPNFYGKTLHFFGHCHGNMPGDARCHDVGVDAIGYFPLRAGAIVELMQALPRRMFKQGEPFDNERKVSDSSE